MWINWRFKCGLIEDSFNNQIPIISVIFYFKIQARKIFVSMKWKIHYFSLKIHSYADRKTVWKLYPNQMSDISQIIQDMIDL